MNATPIAQAQRIRASALAPRRFATSLGIGAFLTILTSWAAMFLPTGNAWFGPRADEDLGLCMDSQGRTWSLARGANAWHTTIIYWHMQISGQSLTIPTADYEARRFDPGRLPRSQRPESIDALRVMAWYHRTGWPFPALACSVHWKTQIANADVLYSVRGGVQLPRDSQFNPRALPLSPCWAGFAANTLLFSALFTCVGAGIARLRRSRRARRGLCPFCGYPRAGLTSARCPECGR